MIDTLVHSRLEALARDNRRGIPPVATTLRAIGAVGEAPAAEREATTGDLAVLDLARVFASRVARAAAGAMALVCTLALWLFAWNPWCDDTGTANVSDWSWSIGDACLAIVVVLVLVAHATAGRVAMRVVERRLARDGDALDIVRDLARRAASWALPLAIAGATSILAMFAVAELVVGVDHAIGVDNWVGFWWRPRTPSVTSGLLELLVAIPLIAAASLAIARACAHGDRRWLRVLSHSALAPLGIAIGIAALTVRVRLDAAHTTGALVLALLLVVTPIAVRLWRREVARIDAAAGRPSSPRLVVTRANATAARVASLVAGATALCCAAGALIMLATAHHPDGIARTLALWIALGAVKYTGALGLTMSLEIAIRACALVAIAYQVGVRIAARVPTGGWLPRLDGWSIAATTAGATAIATLLAVVTLVVGGQWWDAFDWPPDRIYPTADVFADPLRDLALVIALAIAASVAVARACTRRSPWLRALEHPAVIALAAAIVVAALAIGATLDVGPVVVLDPTHGGPNQPLPSPAFRTALTFVGATALFIAVAGLALRRRRLATERG